SVLAFGGTGLASHVLRQYRAQRHSADEERPHVAMGRTYNVILPQIDAAADRDRFLTASNIHTANNFPLPVELAFDPEFQFPCQLHVIKHVEESLIRR